MRPVLKPRDRFGRGRGVDRVSIRPIAAWRRLRSGRFGLHAMTHRGGVMGWALGDARRWRNMFFHYVFAQAEFRGCCARSNLTDSFVRADPAVWQRGDPGRAISIGSGTQDMDELLRCAQFMTEKAGGVRCRGRRELTAVPDGETWRLWGEKWFLLETWMRSWRCCWRVRRGRRRGTRGARGCFCCRRRSRMGARNGYRIVRLKDKLGSRSMASGGDRVRRGGGIISWGGLDRGLKQMMEMVNSSRLSHLTRGGRDDAAVF